MIKKICFSLLALFVPIFCMGLSVDEPPVTEGRRHVERYNKDPIAVRSMNPVFDEFPDSSLVDFSYLLDPPAGKHGFVKVGEDGHFHFEKTGARVRFWGVTVAASHIDIPKERIRLAVDTIARAGCNVLRLHEIDNRGGEKYNLVRRNIIDEAWPHNNDSRHFDPEYRDRLDYWIWCAKQKGVYVYLVVRGYRTFRAGDGVAEADKLDRKAKPYGYLNSRLLDLQDEYITEWLFKHKNPYTRLPNGLDPAVCMIELINEDSLFFEAGEWTSFIEPYRSEFQKLWNDWLKGQYGSTDALRRAWTIPGGEWSALLPEERLADGTVQIPDMKARPAREIAPELSGEPLSHPLRQRDGARFAAHLQRKIFARQRDLIRSMGCPIPLTAVVNSEVIPDTWSVAQELDFTGENAYQDHPAFKSGEAWVGKSFFKNTNYLRQTGPWSPPAFMARYKWAGKPLVCREWTLCWPNEYRNSSNIAMATQALLQDYDGMIHFAYYTAGDHFICSSFGMQADPARWGTFGYAAELFINGDIKPAERLIEIAYTDEDLFRYGSYIDHLYDLSWECRLQNHHFSGAAQSGADIRISSGRSGLGIYTGMHNILWDCRFERWNADSAARRQSLFFTSGYQDPLLLNGADFSTSPVLRGGYVPLWEGAGQCGGFYDPRSKNIILKNVDSTRVVEAARGLLRTIEKPDAPFMPILEPGSVVIRSGEVIRDIKNGRVLINTPRLRAVMGELNPAERFIAGGFSVLSQSPNACLVALSLDGKPLEESKRFSVKMATVATNRGQMLKPVTGEDAPGRFVLEYPGSVPVQTQGKASETPTALTLGGAPLIEAFLINGTWEAVFDRERGEVMLTCDTPNVRFRLGKAAFGAQLPETLSMQRFYCEYPPSPAEDVKPDFIYPGYAKYVRMAAPAR